MISKYEMLNFYNRKDFPPGVYYLYALVDPDTEEIRYVGTTKNIQSRYVKHLKSGKTTPVKDWVKSLLLENKYPKLKILEILKTRSAIRKWEIESELINRYRHQGYNLLNVYPLNHSMHLV